MKHKKEINALTVWAVMIVLLLGLFLISPKSDTTGFAGVKVDAAKCKSQAQAHCISKGFGNSPQTLTDTNLCTGSTGSATLYSSNNNRKFVYDTGDVTYNAGNYVCVVCTDGRTKVHNKKSGEHCGNL